MSEAHTHHLMSPTKNQLQSMSSSLSPSPRLFMGLPPKIFSENDSSMMSPTSILDSKAFPFISNPSTSNSTHRKPLPIGLAEALDHDEDDFSMPKKERRMVLFGSQLKIQIPSIEFGVKNKESQLALLSPVRRYICTPNETETDRSEEYTCVISHGPNPRTTHIFDDCVINGDLGGLKLDELLTSGLAFQKSYGHGDENSIYRCEKTSKKSESMEVAGVEGADRVPYL